MELETSIGTVALYAMLTAVATGLGALPFAAIKNISAKWVSYGDAMAAGLMLAASFNLITEGLNYGMPRTVFGIVIGLVFIVWSRRYLNHDEESQIGKLKGANAIKALMVVGVMTLHSFAEGIGVGVSFGGGETFGVFITSAIALHNVPEGLAIALVLIPKGVSVTKAIFWSIFSSLPQPLMAVPAYLFVELFEIVLPAGLGLAAGAMIWMVFSEMIPDALADSSPQHIAVIVTISIAAMVAFQALLAI